MFTHETIEYAPTLMSFGHYKSNHRLSLKYLQEPEWSNVTTKCCKSGDWLGLSLIGYSDDPNDLSKPKVLGYNSKTDNQPYISHLRNYVEGVRPTLIYEMNILKSITSIVENFKQQYDCELDRVRLLKVKPNAVIKKHTDKVDKDFLVRDYPLRRFHIPIKTNPDAIMTVYGDKEVSINMKENHLYAVDVTTPHSVVNGDEERIHLVIDAFLRGEIYE